jgi:CRISPR-associated protein Csx16
MATYFVSRHEGAKEWARRRGIEAELISHLVPAQIKSGDVVLGTLPIHLVAEINERGARYLHLELPLKADMRGVGLSADDMEKLGATLTEYEARRVSAD